MRTNRMSAGYNSSTTHWHPQNYIVAYKKFFNVRHKVQLAKSAAGQVSQIFTLLQKKLPRYWWFRMSVSVHVHTQIWCCLTNLQNSAKTRIGLLTLIWISSKLQATPTWSHVMFGSNYLVILVHNDHSYSGHFFFLELKYIVLYQVHAWACFV